MVGIHECSYSEVDAATGLAKRDFFQDQGRKWPAGHTFRWKVEGAIGRIPVNDVEIAVTHACAKWSKMSGFKFEKATGKPNLIITTTGRGPDREFPSNKNIMAIAQMGAQGGGNVDQQYGIITFNNSPSGFHRWGSARTIHDIFLHEFGHVTGLGHVRGDTMAAMAPIVQSGREEKGFNRSDLQKFQNLYRNIIKVNFAVLQPPQQQYGQRRIGQRDFAGGEWVERRGYVIGEEQEEQQFVRDMDYIF
ncbi:hypothetical protein H072_1499 [Dactylellina haptotyla CBS 200.50]|uniref:Peptidase M10 metallopeptidase domain-containing protein n=1 Tax=Dactylellina haptotyla (strain CBS 200.50) TaxID=1284197 RepID=S8AU80_DACHA|nr:hypothetical protein H072_1499 [Dactylellina haptotyla CBS 200.50]